MTEPPITDYIARAKDRDPEAEEAIWNHYFARVLRLSHSRMLALQGVVYDEEDAAVSALRSLFRGIQSNRFPELHDRQNLWRILVLITKRKLRAQWRRENAARRTAISADAPEPEITIEQAISEEPTPDFVVEMMDEVDRLLTALDNDLLKRIAVMKMDGLTNDEVATRLGCASRTVRRKVDRIRCIWGDVDSE